VAENGFDLAEGGYWTCPASASRFFSWLSRAVTLYMKHTLRFYRRSIFIRLGRITSMKNATKKAAKKAPAKKATKKK